MMLEEFVRRVPGGYHRNGQGGYMLLCPGHQDRVPSLSASAGKDGRILLKCMAGCRTKDILAAIGLRMADLFPDSKPNGKGEGARIEAIYDYRDERGNLLFQVVRYEGKQFKQRRPDGKGGWTWNLDGVRRVLFNLPAIVKAQSIVDCEGEKDCVTTAERLGLTATCNPHGAGKWRPEYSESLRGKRVAIVADADAPGRMHAAQVAASLFGKVETLKVLEMPGAKDLSEWVEHGGTRKALLGLIKSVPEWTPASGSDGLDAAFAYVSRFVSLSEAQARAVALWVAHTHCFEAADCTPYLSINSAEKQSGKTRLLEVLELLVYEPWLTGRVSSAVLARKIDAKHPTLLLDESDTAFGSEKEYAEALRGVLNTGYRRGGASSCCVGQGANITFKDFATFCPKAIAGIGKLPDTVADRSIPIRLKRAERGKVQRFRKREAEREASGISSLLASWCAENIKKLSQARPEIPSKLSDRQADVSEPLLAIADLAGGDWPLAARQAIVELCTRAQADDDSIGARLLSDVRQVFTEKNVDELPSKDLCECLAQIETSPWGEWSKGKPLSAAKLARLLKPYEIYPGQIDNGKSRGYRLEDFQEAFSLYLPPKSVKVSDDRENSGDDGNLKVSNEKPSDTLENAVSPNNHAGLRHFDTLEPGEGETEREAQGLLSSDEVTL